MSKSPFKPKKLQQILLTSIQVEEIDYGKIVYCVAQKISDSGIFNNKRFLLINANERYIGYSNNLPTSIPFQTSTNVLQTKKKFDISTIQFSKSKTKDNCLEISSATGGSKGKKQTWLFIFKNNKMIEELMNELKNIRDYPFDSHAQKEVVSSKKSITNRQQKVSPVAELSREERFQPLPGIKTSNQNLYIQKKPNPYIEEPLNSKGTNKSDNSRINYMKEQNTGTYSKRNEVKQQIIQNKNVQLKQSQLNNEKVEIKIQNQKFTKYSYRNSKMEEPPIEKDNPQNLSYIPKTENLIYTPKTENSIYKSNIKQPAQQEPILKQPKRESYLKRFQNKNLILEQNTLKVQQMYQRSGYQDWNLEFYLTKNHIKIMMQFKKKSEEIVQFILNEFEKNPNQRKIQPVHKAQQLSRYQIDGLEIKIAFSKLNQNQGGQFLDKNLIRELKNEFRNYEYLINITQNQGLFRVPLTCFVQYKGFNFLVKAMIKNFQQIQANELTSQIIKLEKIIKIKRQIFNNRQNLILKHVSIKNTIHNLNIVYIDELKNFIPYDASSIHANSLFKKQILVDQNMIFSGEKLLKETKNQKIITDLQELQKKIKEKCDKILIQFENLEVIILNQIDLKRLLHTAGINARYISYLYKNATIPLLKNYFLSQMIASICRSLFNNHIQIQIDEISNSKVDSDEIFKQAAVNFMNDLLYNTENSQKLWKLIFKQLKIKHGIVSKKDQISNGYFQSSFLSKISVKLNYKLFQKNSESLKTEKLLPYEFVQQFLFNTKCYDLKFTHQILEIIAILKQEPNQTGFDNLVQILQLRQSKIPQYCKMYDLEDKIIMYLANFIPADVDKELFNEFKNLEIYDVINKIPPTLTSIRLALMAIKWAIKRKQQKIAIQIFENTSELITFWGNEFHPLLGEFYDFFSLYYITNGQFEQAITLGKSSLVNTIKIIGTNSLSTAEKYYQLGNIYFKIGKKQEALNHYLKTKDILANNKKTNIPQYGIISLKLALLYLNFGKITESIDLAFQCLKIFENVESKNHEQDLLETFQILSRAYQITQKKTEAIELSNICSQKLNNTQDPKIFERTLKISLYPHLVDIPVTSGKILLNILENLPLIRLASSYNQAFNYLKSRARNQIIIQVFLSYIQKIDKLSAQIKNKQLIKKHKGLQSETKSEAQDFLVLLQSIIYMIDQSYLIGILRQFEYY